MTRVVCDSSTIISIADSCLIHILKKLSINPGFEFIIPKSVEAESVTRPFNINRFKLNAIRINDGIKEGWIKVWPESSELTREIELIQGISNDIFSSEKGSLTIVHKGEAESLALLKKLNIRGLLIDERTTRMLVEKPLELKKWMEKIYKQKLELNKEQLKKFQNYLPEIKIVRSTELIALGYELGHFEGELTSSIDSLEAALYSVKFNGCSVSFKEIEQFIQSIK